MSSTGRPNKTHPDSAPAADLLRQQASHSVYADVFVLHQLAVDCPVKEGGSVYAGGVCVQSAPSTFVRWVV